MRSNGGRKLGSPGRRTPDSADSAFCVRGQLALEPPCLPGKRCAVLQESSAPRADEHAIWDTLRSRKPGSLRAMLEHFDVVVPSLPGYGAESLGIVSDPAAKSSRSWRCTELNFSLTADRDAKSQELLSLSGDPDGVALTALLTDPVGDLDAILRYGRAIRRDRDCAADRLLKLQRARAKLRQQKRRVGNGPLTSKRAYRSKGRVRTRPLLRSTTPIVPSSRGLESNDSIVLTKQSHYVASYLYDTF